MTASPTIAAQSLREVRRGVALAADAQVLQVVRMVDALDDRGATDEVLAPVRPRLRAIQPARPLRFARLLFMPADPLIVAPRAWRPGTSFLPRNALLLLATAVRGVMQESGAADACLQHTDRLIEGASTAQTAIVRAGGALLWPQAACVLARLATGKIPAQCQADWAQAGLPAAELAPIAGSLSAILAVALVLHDHDHSGLRLQDADLAGLLAAGEPFGTRAWGMLLSLLLIRAPQASATLFAAAQVSRMPRSLTEAAADTALTTLEAEADAQVATIPPGAPGELNRQASLLDILAGQCADAAQRKRVAQARASLLSGALTRLEAALHDRIAAPLLTLPATPAARDAALDALETDARTLRAFEQEARRLGGDSKFDGLIRQVEQTVAGQAALSPMDRARLVEILAGPEAALRML